MWLCFFINTLSIERFSIKCREIKTRVNPNNQPEKGKYFKSQSELQVKPTQLPKRGKTRATKS